MAWSQDGKRLATGSYDPPTAELWEVEGKRGELKEAVLTLKGHYLSVRGVAWSPDGKRLATGSYDQTAKLWDAVSGQELLTLQGHDKPVYTVAWSPDGKRLATAGADGSVQVYAMDIHDLLILARTRVTRDLTPEECKRYFHSEKCPPMP